MSTHPTIRSCLNSWEPGPRHRTAFILTERYQVILAPSGVLLVIMEFQFPKTLAVHVIPYCHGNLVS